LNRLITSKVELHKSKNALEDQIDLLKEKQGTCDANISILQAENARIERAVLESSQNVRKELNEGNLDE